MQDLDLTDEELENAPELTEVPDPPGRIRASALAPRATVGPSGQTHLLTADVSWTWRELRDYVVAMARQTHGQLLQRDPAKEKSIFEAFVRRHGPRAAEIARYAFEVSPHPGYWKNAPIRFNRFTINSDPYFASEIIKNHLG